MQHTILQNSKHAVVHHGTANPKPLERILCADQSVFHQGDEARFVYEILSGVMRKTHVSRNGDRQVIGFCYPHDIVGFTDDRRYHTECVAITDVRAVIHRHEALNQPDADPVLQRRLISAALQEITDLQNHFKMIGRKSAIEKVSCFLCDLGRHIGKHYNGTVRIDVPMKRADIADFLGLTTETVCRTFTQLRQDAVITMDNPHRIIIQRPDLLAEI